MPEKLREVQPPRGCARWLFRAPIRLFQWGLGWIFMGRALLLEHTGRRSGRTRYVVLEVIRHDEEEDAYYVASGWGEKSDWFQNILQDGRVQIRVGRRRARAFAECVPLDEAGEEILRYARKYPLPFRSLMRMIGYRVQHSDEELRGMAEVLPVVRIKPDQMEADVVS
jgi:deazaflavin-dependent oxidoreductase (nitroreductase family)